MSKDRRLKDDSRRREEALATLFMLRAELVSLRKMQRESSEVTDKKLHEIDRRLATLQEQLQSARAAADTERELLKHSDGGVMNG